MNKNKLTAMFLASVMCCSNTTKVGAHGWLYHIGKVATYFGCVKIAKSIDLWDLSENVNNLRVFGYWLILLVMLRQIVVTTRFVKR